MALALDRNPAGVRRARQRRIDSIVDLVANLISNKQDHYVNFQGKPLLPKGFDLEIADPVAALKGFYLSGCMDSSEWRSRVEENFSVKIGKISDELAILCAGRKYGIDAALSVFLGDAIDTWDKNSEVVTPGGQCECLGDMISSQTGKIAEKYSEDRLVREDGTLKLVSDEDVMKFICTINLQKPYVCRSSYLRYLLQVDKSSGQSPIESHMRYLKGEEYAPMHLGYFIRGLWNSQLYSLLEKRMKENY